LKASSRKVVRGVRFWALFRVLSPSESRGVFPHPDYFRIPFPVSTAQVPSFSIALTCGLPAPLTPPRHLRLLPPFLSLRARAENYLRLASFFLPAFLATLPVILSPFTSFQQRDNCSSSSLSPTSLSRDQPCRFLPAPPGARSPILPPRPPTFPAIFSPLHGFSAHSNPVLQFSSRRLLPLMSVSIFKRFFTLFVIVFFSPNLFCTPALPPSKDFFLLGGLTLPLGLRSVFPPSQSNGIFFRVCLPPDLSLSYFRLPAGRAGLSW